MQLKADSLISLSLKNQEYDLAAAFLLEEFQLKVVLVVYKIS
jgi:hypothetical protein